MSFRLGWSCRSTLVFILGVLLLAAKQSLPDDIAILVDDVALHINSKSDKILQCTLREICDDVTIVIKDFAFFIDVADSIP